MVYNIQCILSLLFSSQFAALSVNFCGTLAGLFLQFVSDKAYTPWSLMGSLRSFDMYFDSVSKTVTYFKHFSSPTDYLTAFLYLIITFALGLFLFTRTERDSLVSGISSGGHSLFFQNILPAELIKLKRSPVWITFFVLPLISALIGTFNFKQNQGILSFTWEDLWTQHSLFLGLFFLAPLIGILCSMLWRMEHSGSNWNLILTVTSPAKLVKDKILTSAALSSLCILWIAVVYLLSGKAVGITGSVPTIFYIRLLCSIFCVSAIAAFQSLFSLVIRSFAIPVGLALFGSFSGFALNIKDLYFLSPYAMLEYGMGSTRLSAPLNFPFFLFLCLLYILFAYIMSVLYLKKTDRCTHV